MKEILKELISIRVVLKEIKQLLELKNVALDTNEFNSIHNPEMEEKQEKEKKAKEEEVKETIKRKTRTCSYENIEERGFRHS